MECQHNCFTSGESCMLFSSWSEICLRVIKVCSTSVSWVCSLWVPTSPSLFQGWERRIYHKREKVHFLDCQHQAWKTIRHRACGDFTEQVFLTASWAGSTAWFCSHDWQRRFFQGCLAAPPSQGAERVAADFVSDQTCPGTPETPNQAGQSKQEHMLQKTLTGRDIRLVYGRYLEENLHSCSNNSFDRDLYYRTGLRKLFDSQAYIMGYVENVL